MEEILIIIKKLLKKIDMVGIIRDFAHISAFFTFFFVCLLGFFHLKTIISKGFNGFVNLYTKSDKTSTKFSVDVLSDLFGRDVKPYQNLVDRFATEFAKLSIPIQPEDDNSSIDQNKQSLQSEDELLNIQD